MRRGTPLLAAGLTGVTILLSVVAVGYEMQILRLLGPVDSLRLKAVTGDADLIRSLLPLVGLTVARVLLLLGIVVVATGAAAPDTAAEVAAAPPASPAAPAVPTLARPTGVAAVACWVFGLILLVGGGTGQLVAFVANAEDDATFARQLDELAGRPQGSAAAADELQARTDRVAEALNDYVASSEKRVSARNDLVEGFNSGVVERNTSGSVDIARNRLPGVIDRYQQSVANLAEKEAALMTAVARLGEAQ